MRKRKTRRRFEARPAEMMAAYAEYREDELLDAAVSAAALVARADTRIDAAERRQLLDFLEREGVLSVFTPAEIIEVFERRLRELNEPGGAVATLRQLKRHAERPLARVAIDAGEEIAAADCRIDPREQQILQLIRLILGGQLVRSASRPNTAGGTR
jgi:tellurite resistance protein